MDIAKFKQLPLIGIIRGVEISMVELLVNAVIAAGMQTIEITMNTPDAGQIIKQTIKNAKNKLTVGAGTVLNKDDLKAALNSGASFIVMPTNIPEIMQHCVKNNIPVFPGALTPQEIHSSWSQGAAMVKVFPAYLFGPKYFRELLGPFDDIRLMAVGGVRLENITEYFKCGAQAVAVGSSVFNLRQMQTGDFKSIENSLFALVNKVKQAHLKT